ncbi:hypothetical protein BS78_08G005900 [Paspalum vaginatum]|nr:hypothetical protein BS78_08G005900 [Paspalum vaginatum]
MSMLSSYTTLLGLAPPLPGKLFSRSAPPPAAATVSLPGVPVIISRPQQQSSRAPRFRCCAYDIRHNALVELKRIRPEMEGDKWTIAEDKDYITL